MLKVKITPLQTGGTPKCFSALIFLIYVFVNFEANCESGNSKYNITYYLVCAITNLFISSSQKIWFLI